MGKKTEFILKRCFRFGVVKRFDLEEAFSDEVKSTSVLTSALNNAVYENSEYIMRQGKKIIPKPSVDAPAHINDDELLESLSNGALFKDTGLRSRELPINIVVNTNSLPVQQGALTRITSAIAHEKVISIHYVGLRLGDKGKLRDVYPLGLEKKSDQWRLVAHDLSDPLRLIKSFLLSRIISVERQFKNKPYRSRKPEVLPVGSISMKEAPQKLKVQLNPEFTEEQKIVIRNQIRVKDGHIYLPKRYIFEFKIDYAKSPGTESIVWPILSEVSE